MYEPKLLIFTISIGLTVASILSSRGSEFNAPGASAEPIGAAPRMIQAATLVHEGVGNSGEFSDASNRLLEDDDDDAIFYDAQSELDAEEDGERICKEANFYQCDSCCKHQAFDRPFWDRYTGECSCYMSQGETNACRDANTEASCKSCCATMSYREHDFIASARDCLCSNPSETLATGVL